MNPARRDYLHSGQMLFRLVPFERSTDPMDEPPVGVAIHTKEGETVCDNQDFYPHEVDPAYMRRIVACLNHCHGMRTEDLEKQNALLGLTV